MDNIGANYISWLSRTQEKPKTVAVVTLGYQSFQVSADFLSTILHAAATGNIQAVDKKWKGNGYQAVLKGLLDVQVEHLDIVQDNEPEIKKLKERLSELESGNG